MKQVINVPGPTAKTNLESGPVPEPSAKQVLIKVIVSGSNPKDWKVPELAAKYEKDDDGSFMAVSKKGINQGDDIAGIVQAVGQDVLDFKVRCHAGNWSRYVVDVFSERRPCCSFSRDGSSWRFVRGIRSRVALDNFPLARNYIV